MWNLLVGGLCGWGCGRGEVVGVGVDEVVVGRGGQVDGRTRRTRCPRRCRRFRRGGRGRGALCSRERATGHLRALARDMAWLDGWSEARNARSVVFVLFFSRE